MNFRSSALPRRLALGCLALTAFACAVATEDDMAPSPGGGESGASGTGGADTTDGTGGSTATGGGSTAAGGTSGTGGAGAATGDAGGAGTGGTATGSGGDSASGGTNTGGTNTGGTNTGGTNTGGTSSCTPVEADANAVTGNGFRVQVKSDSQALNNSIAVEVWILNDSAGSVALSELKARYYFTSEPGANLAAKYCFTQAENPHVPLSDYLTTALSPTTGTGADTYLELGFTSGAGQIVAGQRVKITCGISEAGWANFDETDDWSYDPCRTSERSDFDRVTLHRNSDLIWGTVPTL
jgi:hypothetical protein